MTFGRSALAYAVRGFHVFPCRVRGKEPLVAHGEHDATTDASVIDGWARRWPRANVGIVPGASGLFVLDVDTRHYGDETLQALPPLPDTATTLTGGGGLHLWFRRPVELDGVRCRALRVDGLHTSGVDVKGVTAGYLVVPPSIHPSGRRYVWEASGRVDEVEIADPPRWLVRMILDGSKRPCTATPHAVPVDPESFSLGVMFARSGMLGPQLRPGVFAVRCPNERMHSDGRGALSSTVIFAPSTPGGRGTFFCSHTSGCSEVFR